MRVDVHTHYLPEPLRDRLRARDVPVNIADNGSGNPSLVHSSSTLPLSPGFRDLDARLDWMDKHDIDITIASVSTPNPNEPPFEPEESVELVRAINDGYLALSEKTDRVVGLAALPLVDPEAALEEINRVERSGFPGVAIPTSVRGQKLSDPALEPVFDRLDESDLTAFMHPRRNSLSGDLDEEEWMFDPLVVFPTETTFQVGRLIFDGFFDQHDFELVIAHMGGALPYLVGRLDRGRDAFRSESDVAPKKPVIEYLQEFYYDTISFHRPAIQATIETVGTDQLVFGTDYPFGIEDAESTFADLESVDLSTADQRRVMGETASQLFGL